MFIMNGYGQKHLPHGDQPLMMSLPIHTARLVPRCQTLCLAPEATWRNNLNPLEIINPSSVYL